MHLLLFLYLIEAISSDHLVENADSQSHIFTPRLTSMLSIRHNRLCQKHHSFQTAELFTVVSSLNVTLPLNTS